MADVLYIFLLAMQNEMVGNMSTRVNTNIGEQCAPLISFYFKAIITISCHSLTVLFLIMLSESITNYQGQSVFW